MAKPVMLIETDTYVWLPKKSLQNFQRTELSE